MFLRLFGLAVILILGTTGWLQADDAPSKKKESSFKVVRFVTGEAVGVDRRGVCLVKKRPFTTWWMKDFPTKIEKFESCITLSSPEKRGRVDFTMEIVASDESSLLQIDGRIDLGMTGRASQMVEWNELEVMTPGTYHIAITIDNEQVGRYPIRLGKAGRGS